MSEMQWDDLERVIGGPDSRRSTEQLSRLTDVQQDAGGRWEWDEEIESFVRDGVEQTRVDVLAALSRLSEEQQARQRAEQERDTAQKLVCGCWILRECDVHGEEATTELGLERLKFMDAEAENTRLRAQVERLEAKAALADEIAAGLGPRGRGYIHDFAFGLWLDRYAALTATQEPADAE